MRGLGTWRKHANTDLEVLSGVGPPALLPLLCSVDGLHAVQHQILQLQRFHQVCVPHDAWRREEEVKVGKNNHCGLHVHVIVVQYLCQRS